MSSDQRDPRLSDYEDLNDVSNEIIFSVPNKPIAKHSNCKVYAAAIRLGTATTVAVAVKRMIFKNVEASVRVHEFCKEATALHLVNHKNIIPFIGVCKMGQDICIVTEWAANGSLSQYLAENDTADRLDIWSQVALGLEYLHCPVHNGKPKIVHGDLHDGNVLIAADGVIKICDFGLSKVVPDGSTASISTRPESVPLGRVAYIAPELHDTNVPRSCITDVFSFGILGWYVFTGSVPFEDRAGGAPSIMHCLATGQRPQRNEIRRTDCTDSSWGVITECWSAIPDSRPTMKDVRTRLWGLSPE